MAWGKDAKIPNQEEGEEDDGGSGLKDGPCKTENPEAKGAPVNRRPAGSERAEPVENETGP
jgi:hypothetical protein